MSNGLTLSQHDQDLIAILADYGVDLVHLSCEFSRQQGSGVGRFKGALRNFGDGTYNISYDLMLCAYCGNLLPQSPCCPAKFQRIKEYLIRQYEATQARPVEREVLLLPAWREPLLLASSCTK